VLASRHNYLDLVVYAVDRNCPSTSWAGSFGLRYALSQFHDRTAAIAKVRERTAFTPALNPHEFGWMVYGRRRGRRLPRRRWLHPYWQFFEYWYDREDFFPGLVFKFENTQIDLGSTGVFARRAGMPIRLLWVARRIMNGWNNHLLAAFRAMYGSALLAGGDSQQSIAFRASESNGHLKTT
jgi:hypothetical protein